MNKEYTINCKKDETVLEALRRQGITIRAFCNGRHSCGKCRIMLDEENMSEVTYEEMYLLTDEENAMGARLACFVKPDGGDVDSLKVTVLDMLESEAPIQTGTGDLSMSFSIGDLSFVAIDIGTTTIAAKMIKGGEVIYTASRMNSQCSYGADVISRSESAIKGYAEELSNCLMDDINAIIDELPENPGNVIISANTTMIHLLMEYPLAEMINYPFRPYYTGWHKKNFMMDSGKILPWTILPNLSAYIGGDVVSGLYFCDFTETDKVNLFIDLGTNGEMAIGNRQRILTASAAAGPAFEGTRLNVATDVIKCMADLRRNGIIDENGSLKDPYFDEGYNYKNSGMNDYVTLYQKDIRDIQMAKSAIRAGIEILMKKYGVTALQVNKLYLAGGMGHGLDIHSAVEIGLLPKELESKTVPVGNSSLAGSIKYGNSGFDDSDIEKIISVSEEVLLSNEKEFSGLYYEYMQF
ncbi:MAG: ASKHA domain-containing protein [Lachnospiraceae bacterium]|nr:ASKHA domain-containing protein [Lachnospiraceae bacterium]